MIGESGLVYDCFLCGVVVVGDCFLGLMLGESGGGIHVMVGNCFLIYHIKITLKPTPSFHFSCYTGGFSS